ncbi:PhlD [Streptomyces sp. NPDC056672]|uniref:PhlD n=1 Tax=Streptomyces sp. NPDC056672 TaxID=3345906 RepID=UPI00369BA0A9
MGIETRRFAEPLDDVARPASFEARNARAVRHVTELGEQAARRALDAAGLDASEIATLITVHATGLAVPGLDVHLANALKLPSTVLRIPMTQLACAGGAQALGMAARLASPGRPVLVAGAEQLTSSWQPGDSSMDSLIFKMLFGDGGAAAVVSAEPLAQPGLVIEDSWTYLHRDSTHYYKLRADKSGYHFVSEKEARSAVSHILPELPWPGWTADYAVIHPGGARILDLIAKHGICSEETLCHSRASMRISGNTGGTAVLRVLDRLHDDPPPQGAGAQGLLFGVGPGFCAAASRTRWMAEMQPLSAV